VKRRLQVENDLAVLNGNHTARGETASIAKSVDFVQNRFTWVAWAQEIGVKGMDLTIGLVDGASGRNKSLTRNLAAKHSLAIFVGRFTTKDVDLNGLKVQKVDKVIK
jgi:hypothetical protein